MSALTDAQFRLDSGYYNNGAQSPTNPGGFADDGHETNLFAVAHDIVVIGQGASDAADLATAQAGAAAVSAASAINAPGTNATSVTNRTIPAATGGSITLTLVEANKAFGLGQTVLFAYGANSLMQFAGPITAFDPASGVMTIAVQFIAAGAAGQGPYASWKVSLSTPVDGSLTGRVAALEAANAKQKSRARLFFKEFI